MKQEQPIAGGTLDKRTLQKRHCSESKWSSMKQKAALDYHGIQIKWVSEVLLEDKTKKKIKERF